MKVEKICHLHAYTTRNVDAVARLFAELFGMKTDVCELKDWGINNGLRTCVVRPEGSPAFLEFLQPIDLNGEASKALNDRPEGLLFVSVKVPDIREAIAEMESRGIKLTYLWDGGEVKQAWFDPKNTFGVGIELGEYPWEHLPFEQTIAAHRKISA